MARLRLRAAAADPARALRFGLVRLLLILEVVVLELLLVLEFLLLLGRGVLEGLVGAAEVLRWGPDLEVGVAQELLAVFRLLQRDVRRVALRGAPESLVPAGVDRPFVRAGLGRAFVRAGLVGARAVAAPGLSLGPARRLAFLGSLPVARHLVS